MKELSQPSTVPVPWTFRATIPIDHQWIKKGQAKIVAMVSETTVEERFAFDARKRAAEILGVDPGSLELVK